MLAPCKCGGTCDSCTSKRVDLERDGSPRDTDPDRALRGLAGTGRSLPESLRGFLEQRFAQSLGDVRIHDGTAADDAAKALGARAFTVGNRIGMRSGIYPPKDDEGLATLAHEIAHAVQQRGAPVTDALEIGPAGSAAELHAESAAQRVISGDAVSAGPATPAIVARRPSTARPRQRGRTHRRPRRKPNTETEPETTTNSEPAPVEVPPAHLGDRGSDTDWQTNADAAGYRNWAIGRQAQLETPMVVMHRGGAAPDFITVGSKSSVVSDAGEIDYWPRFFHVLDAIESDVKLATTPAHVYGLYMAYFPELQPRRSLYAVGSYFTDPDGNKHEASLPAKSAVGQLVGPVDASNADSLGLERMAVFRKALADRANSVAELAKVKIPELAVETWARQYAEAVQDLERGFYKKRTTGSCNEKEVARKGGNNRHDKYAKQVTGSDMDYELTTPEGITCVTDGKDVKNPKVLWEVKTKHDWVTDDEISGTTDWPGFADRISDLEAQRAKCLVATARCGYSYWWALERKEVADALNMTWGMIPPCLYKAYKGS